MTSWVRLDVEICGTTTRLTRVLFRFFFSNNLPRFFGLLVGTAVEDVFCLGGDWRGTTVGGTFAVAIGEKIGRI